MVITSEILESFRIHLLDDEKSGATVSKYMHDLRTFMFFANGRELDKPLCIEYKNKLCETYSVTSVNSMLAALNAFLRFFNLDMFCVKQLRVQKKVYCSEQKELSREEYTRLVSAAKARGDTRLSLIIQTICSTGIRVSELEYITVEAVCAGEATVSCKNKTRAVFIVPKLRKKLLEYAKKQNIDRGALFVTKSGRPINRSNIWRAMKSLCDAAGIAAEKVFPHNLRHLFARTFYKIEKDIARLADVLGHTNINTTRIYIITTGAEHKRRIENMRLVI